MSSHKQRLEKLEKQHAPENKIYVTKYGENGRVSYGSPELMGMTEAEVNQYVGTNDTVVKIVCVGIDLEKL